jgi:hypothetical protein
MKKIALIFGSTCLLLVSVVSLHAQKTSSAIIKAGVNFANVSVEDDGDIDDAKMLTSFQVGIIGDFNLAPFLALQPGLIFTGKGSKTQSGDPGDASWYRATSNPYYLEVPVNLVFKTQGPVRFFAGAGPYLAMGVGGKNKTDGEVLGASFHSEDNIEWSNDDPTTLDYEEDAGFGIMKRFDYGLNVLAGIEVSNLVLSANYGLGLAKLQSGSNSSEDNNNKHRVFSLTAGFKF